MLYVGWGGGDVEDRSDEGEHQTKVGQDWFVQLLLRKWRGIGW